MNEYDVNEFIRECRGAIVVLLLILSLPDENVAQTANDKRACFRCVCRFQ